MNYDILLKKVAQHVALIFIEHTDARLLYHNQTHTTEMIDAVKKIADHYRVDERIYFTVCTAAWFHDTGYLVSGAAQHELKSTELAEKFLKSMGVSDEDIAAVKKCILATRMPQAPQTLPEKIVCDADLFHLGTGAFKEKNKRLKKEIEAFRNHKMNAYEWRANTIALLESHHYHTDYCKSLLDKTKAENLERLKTKQDEKMNSDNNGVFPEHTGSDPEMTEKVITPEQHQSISNNTQKKAEHKTTEPHPENKIKKPERPIRGVETMFRISSSNHQRLSVMADNKAHIMISVNAIIISVAIGFIVRNIKDLPNLVIPTVILLAVNVVTIIYSVLATRPKIPNGVFTKEQIERKTVNLLFFGSFYKMGFKDYEYGMQQMMKDSEFLYGTLIKDIYWQGRVLGRKFHLLRISYDIFMYGIAGSVLAYAIAVVFAK